MLSLAFGLTGRAVTSSSTVLTLIRPTTVITPTTVIQGT